MAKDMGNARDALGRLQLDASPLALLIRQTLNDVLELPAVYGVSRKP